MRLRILLSFWYYKSEGIRTILDTYFAPDYPDIFADSGAYSAWSQGGSVDIESYAEWLERYQDLFTVYANLDVKGDVEAGLKNQTYLEGRGLHPLPVFHAGEPWEVLDEMVERYSYVAIGGIAGSFQSSSPVSYRFLIKCFRIAEGRAALHGFGITSWAVLKDFPWYSVDSSSWGSGFRYGNVGMFDERRGRFVQVHLGVPEEAREHRDIIRRLGFEPKDFARRDLNDRSLNCAVAAVSYIKAEAWLRKRWGTATIPERAGAINAAQREQPVTSEGVKVYLVDGGGLGPSGNLHRAAQGVRIYLASAETGAENKAVAGKGELRQLLEGAKKVEE